MENETIDENFNEDDDNGIELDLLTPLDRKDDPRVKKYLKHLNNAILNPDVRNLALSGVFGSGKSTIIKSYKSKYPKKKILNISLASFNETDDYETFKNQIQLTILQQIIYSRDSEKLPDSRINRIREIDIWKSSHLLKVIVSLLFVISTYSILKFFKSELNPNHWNLSLDFHWWSFICILLFLGSSLFIGLFLIKILSNSKINKINVKGEAELGNMVEHKDFLNKYIDEILYFFEKVNIDIVAIEDLDRFNSTEIYRTLRELNFILNNYLENTKKNFKKVTFLYAIKDDLFLNEFDRTKFFDLIIPTIPFVNFSNSKNVLTKKLVGLYSNEENLFNNPNSNKDFINTVSAFITDNRILINIINEFIVYKEQQKLQKEEFNQEKLLALIIYKNLRPRDFSRLHKGDSNIDIVFYNKNKLVENLIKKHTDDIDEITKTIAVINQENLESVSELNTIFLYHLKESLGNSSVKSLKIGSSEKTYKQIINESIDLRVFYKEVIKWVDVYDRTNNLNKSFEEIDDLVGYKYSEKYNIIVNEDKLIEDNENEIDELRTSIKKLKNETLSQILKVKDLSKAKLKEEFENFYLESEIKENERIYNDTLLVFLLENGYIDEHYRVYISTFQKGGISEKDQEFKINIISRVNEPKSFDYELSNINDIINELPINYFNDSRILNIYLIDFLVIHKVSYSNKLEESLKAVSKWDKRSKKFLTEYLYNGIQKELFIKELARVWQDLWNKIYSDSDFLEKDKKQLLFLILSNLDNETLISLNKKKVLSNYIASNVEIIYDYNSDSELKKIEEVLSENSLNVKFKELYHFGEKHKKQFELIYQHNRYEINPNNIGTILENYLASNFDLETYKKSNISYIYEIELSELADYIEEDSYNTYISNVYSKFENNQYEDEVNILKVLNKKGLLKENAILFLNKQDNKISNLYDIENLNFFSLVFEHNSIEAVWSNIYNYYFEVDNIFDKTLNTFLNNEDNYFYLSANSKIDLKIEKEAQIAFISKLIGNNDLTIDSYTSLLDCLPSDFELSSDFDFESIDKDKIEILIEENVIELNLTYYDSLKKIHTELHIDLLVQEESNYIEFIKDNDIDIADKILVLQNPQLSNKNKLELIDRVSIIEINSSEELSEELCDLIIKTSSLILSVEKIEALLKQELTIEQKVKLIVLYESKLSNLKIIDILRNRLPSNYNVVPSSQMMLNDNNYNLKLIKLLQNKGIAGKDRKAKNNKVRVWLNNFG